MSEQLQSPKECYKYLREQYGELKAQENVNDQQAATESFLELHVELAKFNQSEGVNGAKLQIFTTNYDQSYAIIATIYKIARLYTHIHQAGIEAGRFDAGWYLSKASDPSESLPALLLNRLYGDVAWVDARTKTRMPPYAVREIGKKIPLI